MRRRASRGRAGLSMRILRACSLALAASRLGWCQPSRDWRRAGAGLQWIRIPGGTFEMGSLEYPNTGPVRRVTIRAFEMAKTLVTNKQYEACVHAGYCTAADDCGASFRGEDQPVVCVDWNQARAFSRWVGGRLPSEAEWEYAARSAGRNERYPWGNQDAACGRAVFSGCGHHATMPVCSRPEGDTAQGLCDMAGDAAEWVEDSYGPYDQAPCDGGAVEAGLARVVRGGSWGITPGYMQTFARSGHDQAVRSRRVGFRPARRASARR